MVITNSTHVLYLSLFAAFVPEILFVTFDFIGVLVIVVIASLVVKEAFGPSVRAFDPFATAAFDPFATMAFDPFIAEAYSPFKVASSPFNVAFITITIVITFGRSDAFVLREHVTDIVDITIINSSIIAINEAFEGQVILIIVTTID